MPKVVSKLFRRPENAHKAIELLQSQGFKEEEIGILASARECQKVVSGDGNLVQVQLPEGGACCARGPLVKIAEEDDPLNALTKLLEIPDDIRDYYQFGLSMGAVLVSVHCEDASRQQLAGRLLREADVVVTVESPSPGFAKMAGYMTQTNPLDAQMSGDFRRY